MPLGGAEIRSQTISFSDPCSDDAVSCFGGGVSLLGCA